MSGTRPTATLPGAVKLPVEVLLIVVSTLHPITDRRTILNCSLVCKDWYSLFYPELWRVYFHSEFSGFNQSKLRYGSFKKNANHCREFNDIRGVAAKDFYPHFCHGHLRQVSVNSNMDSISCRMIQESPLLTHLTWRQDPHIFGQPFKPMPHELSEILSRMSKLRRLEIQNNAFEFGFLLSIHCLGKSQGCDPLANLGTLALLPNNHQSPGPRLINGFGHWERDVIHYFRLNREIQTPIFRITELTIGILQHNKTLVRLLSLCPLLETLNLLGESCWFNAPFDWQWIPSSNSIDEISGAIQSFCTRLRNLSIRAGTIPGGGRKCLTTDCLGALIEALIPCRLPIEKRTLVLLEPSEAITGRDLLISPTRFAPKPLTVEVALLPLQTVSKELQEEIETTSTTAKDVSDMSSSPNKEQLKVSMATLGPIQSIIYPIKVDVDADFIGPSLTTSVVHLGQGLVDLRLHLGSVAFRNRTIIEVADMLSHTPNLERFELISRAYVGPNTDCLHWHQNTLINMIALHRDVDYWAEVLFSTRSWVCTKIKRFILKGVPLHLITVPCEVIFETVEHTKSTIPLKHEIEWVVQLLDDPLSDSEDEAGDDFGYDQDNSEPIYRDIELDAGYYFVRMMLSLMEHLGKKDGFVVNNEHYVRCSR